jgi:hypothetical protein
MADGVDPAMEHVKTAGTKPVPDPIAPQAELYELAPRNDAVLPPGERRNLGIHGTRRTFGAYAAPFVPLACHGPIVLGAALRLKALV